MNLQGEDRMKDPYRELAEKNRQPLEKRMHRKETDTGLQQSVPLRNQSKKRMSLITGLLVLFIATPFAALFYWTEEQPEAEHVLPQQEETDYGEQAEGR